MGEKKVDRFIFKISDKLGEGSYGQVFKGVDEKSKELVAVKMLSKSVINEDEYLRDGLMNEIKIMRGLTGNNVVRLIDVLETSNNYYLVQEFCDGGDFQHLLKKKKCLQKNDALSFFIDLLMGMMELVKKGIIHRDLKPANILIHKGIYKIADFGFSRAIDNFSKQMLTSNVGTPLYQSLQLLKGEKYTSKSDVWSLGFIFYEALYGQTPWTARSIPELIKSITQQPLKFPSDKNIDEPIINMLKGCLQLEEKNRLSWDQLYRHPCFGTSFQFYTNQAKQLEDKATFLVSDLRFKVMKDKIDLETVFHKYDKSGDQSLDIKELTLLLHEIDSKLEREEIEYIFNKIDLDGSNSIDLAEFKKWLEENQVQMSMKKVNNQNLQRRGTQELVKVVPNLSQQPIPDNDEQGPNFDTRQDSYVLNQSKQQPLAYPPLQPSQQYPYPPYLPNQQLPQQPPYPQGPSASQQYPPNLQYGNAQQYYHQGSQQFSGSQQFPPNYPIQGSQHQNPNQQYANSVPNQYPYPNQYPSYPYPMTASQQQLYQQQYQQPPQYVSPLQMQPPANQSQAQERATVTIQKLVYAIEKYNINIWELFRKYDKSDSQSLDVKEFGVMLRKIDSQLTDQDINQAFWLFDTDRSQEITFKEFKDGIEFQVKRIQQQKQGSSASQPQWKY